MNYQVIYADPPWSYRNKNTGGSLKSGALWWRGQCEHLLFGVKEKVKAFRMQEKNIIQCKVGRHSEKPQEFRELIERATPHLPDKIELFARKKFRGWDAWGNEIEL